MQKKIDKISTNSKAQIIKKIDVIVNKMLNRLKHEYANIEPKNLPISVGILIDKKVALESQYSPKSQSVILNFFGNNEQMIDMLQKIRSSTKS